MENKILTLGVLGMFLLASFVSFPGLDAEIIVTLGFLDDIITLDPTDPTGENGWYVDPVSVTFHAHDPPSDSSGLYCIKYRVITEDGDDDPEWETHFIDTYCTDYDFTVTLDDDGFHTVEFYAIDGFLVGSPLN